LVLKQPKRFIVDRYALTNFSVCDWADCKDYYLDNLLPYDIQV